MFQNLFKLCYQYTEQSKKFIKAIKGDIVYSYESFSDF